MYCCTTTSVSMTFEPPSLTTKRAAWNVPALSYVCWTEELETVSYEPDE